MLFNELIFLFHAFLTAFGVTCAFFLSKEALIALIAAYSILSNIFITKQIMLLGCHATATDAFTIGSVLGLNIINEYYGKKAAFTTLYGVFFANMALVLFSWLHLIYLPSEFDTCHTHFQYIFSSTPRIIIASLCAYLISQYIETHLYAWLKEKTNGSIFILRNCFTLPVSQFIDTILFTVIALYGIAHNIADIIMISYAIKLLTIIADVPALYLIKKLRS